MNGNCSPGLGNRIKDSSIASRSARTRKARNGGACATLTPYEEWGASESVQIDPGESGRGLSLTLTPTWGNAGSGTGQLWGASDPRELAPDQEFEAGRRLDPPVA